MLIVQEREVVQEIVRHALRFCLRVKSVQFLGDLLNRVLAIAQLHNFEARPAKTKFATRHKQHAWLLILLIQAHPSRQLRCCGEFRLKQAPSLEGNPNPDAQPEHTKIA